MTKINTCSKTVYALLRPHAFEVVSDNFSPVFKPGARINLAGGVELIETKREDGFFVGLVNDTRYPCLECRAQMSEISPIITQTKKNSGRHTSPFIRFCGHSKMDHSCETCWVLWWRTQCEKYGVDIPHLTVMK